MCGFSGLDWGANPSGLAMAASPDWMHAMLGGLGKSLIKFIATKLRGWKLQTTVNEAMRKLNRRTSHPLINMKYLPEGIGGDDKIDSTQVPGILIQIAIVLGDCPPGYTFPSNASKDKARLLSKAKLRRIQRCIYLYLRLCRAQRNRRNTKRTVQVPFCFIQFLMFSKMSDRSTAIYTKPIFLFYMIFCVCQNK